jgi:hypothetical protein
MGHGDKMHRFALQSINQAVRLTIQEDESMGLVAKWNH